MFGCHSIYCYILIFDRVKYAIRKWCTGRKWHIPMASNRKKSRRRIWLTKWDKIKAHDTLIDWCTGREWPLNCMTVISAWWRSNMPFQRLRGRLNYYITRWRQEVRELVIRCGRESHARPKGPSGPPVSWGPEKSETRCGRESQHSTESWAPGLRLSSTGEQKRHNADGHKSGGQYMAVLFSLQLPLTVKPWVTLFEPLQ